MELNRIAYVEDEPDIRELTDITLSSLGGFEVATYESGAVALESLPGFSPDLILLDVMMPEMDGKELFARLQDLPETKHMPIIFMTAKALVSEKNELNDLGAIGVISKPYDPMVLSDKIREIFCAHAAA